MRMRSIGLACGLAALAGVAPAQPEGAPPHQIRGRAIEAMIEAADDSSLRRFAEEHLAPAYRDSFAPGALLAHLTRVRAACAGFGGVLAGAADGGATRLSFMRESGTAAVLFRLEPAPPHRIAWLDLDAAPPSAPPGAEVAPITWESLERRLDEEAAAGFSGAVLVVRGGKVVLHRGYGLANREKKIPVSTETIFAIGSVPIDFTKAAILKLEELGQLRARDSIGRFLKGVPADKRAITIEHLMTGGSGLPDFHHVNGVDADPDLSWIDRETAVRRILGRELLFAPGTGRKHSHSAWVLLAAVVEIVSGHPYGDFLRVHFFGPAGMKRTGNHEDGERFEDRTFAVGYGDRSAGRINIPKYWGRTSWLVMGSGGMQSTPLDLNRWLDAIRAGRTLRPASASSYFTDAVLLGGDDRGFLCLYTQGVQDRMILCSNAHTGPGDRVSAVGRRLVEMVRGARGDAAPAMEDDGRR